MSEVIVLSDGEGGFPAPLEELWPGVPPEAWLPYREEYPDAFADEGWRVRFGSTLVRGGGITVLVDTGVGPDPSGLPAQARLLDELAEQGVRPEDVDVVFHTHLDGDHIGWNLRPDGSRTFPRARHLVPRGEWEARQREEAVERLLGPIEAAGALELVEGEAEIAPGVVAVPTPGHGPGHTALLVDGCTLIAGDVLHHPAQFVERDWPFMGDQDPEQARRTRAAVLERAEAEGLELVFCHLPAPGRGRVRAGRWEAST